MAAAQVTALQERLCYLRKANGEVPVPFDDLKAGDVFRLIESNGVLVGTYRALSDAVNGGIKAEPINADYVYVQGFSWFKWDGSYEKQFYDVWVQGCDIVLACWPNAGFMSAQDGSGRKWAPNELLAVRVSQYQHSYPRPF